MTYSTLPPRTPAYWRALYDSLPDEPTRISVSNVAIMANPEACPNCFITAAKHKWKRPYQFPAPAVMQYHDKTQKWLYTELLRRDQSLPRCFEFLRDSIAVAPIGRLECTDLDSHMFVYGYPDVVLENDRGTVYLVDNKTAQVKTEDCPQFYQFRAQLNLYAWMLQHGPHRRRVERTALVHFVGTGSTEKEHILEHWKDGSQKLCAPLTPVVVEVELNFDEFVRPLLDRVSSLLTGRTKPRRNPECPDCLLLESFLKAQQGQSFTDEMRWADSRTRQRLEARKRYLTNQDGIQEPETDQEFLVCPGILPYGVLSLWNFDDDVN
ncbi:MAG TPA: PD-(D/E)XK nuclease family protein [Terriglobales bacterium]|nr:PD-(D/E)XK nuclease family protein [Terriglobales bacterium]